MAQWFVCVMLYVCAVWQSQSRASSWKVCLLLIGYCYFAKQLELGYFNADISLTSILPSSNSKYFSVSLGIDMTKAESNRCKLHLKDSEEDDKEIQEAAVRLMLQKLQVYQNWMACSH